jgi:probable rRNA maturation factor
MAIEVQCVSRLPNIPSAHKLKRWAHAALLSVKRDAELTIRVVNATEGRQLNTSFRGKAYATNVLTFVYHEPEVKGLAKTLAKKLVGDIVLCAPVVAREAREQRKTIEAHYAHMTVHGMLHLAGFDHEDDEDAKVMESRERKILALLGFADPYADSVPLGTNRSQDRK